MAPWKVGRYDLLRVLGKGAMGLVYEGRDPSLDRRVAIKTIRIKNLSEQAAADYQARFRVEARSAARLQHPRIVSVYDAGRDGDIAFLVMEFIQGDDLERHLAKGLRHSLAQSVAIMEDLLSALDYAHRQGVIHRDIKPANLLIEPNGRVKLTDFGVARLQDAGKATRTQGTMVGTLKYMSPEQVQGLPVDARADLFAAGIVLYQLLTGKRPFDADSDFAVIQQVVGHSPALPSTLNADLPLAIDAVIATALAKSRDLRFASAQDFALALRVASGDAVDSSLVPPAGPPRKASHATGVSMGVMGETLAGRPSDISQNFSALTHEVELVYWKDIKDSLDLVDIQGFLTRFPTGIYADLAVRRLRKLGVERAQDLIGGVDTPAASLVSVWSAQGLLAGKRLFVRRTSQTVAEKPASDDWADSAQRNEETIALKPVQAPSDAGLPSPSGAMGAGDESLSSAASFWVPTPPAFGAAPLPGQESAKIPTTAQARRQDRTIAAGAAGERIVRHSLRFRLLMGAALLAALGVGASVLWPVAESPIQQAAALSAQNERLLATALPPAAEPVAAPATFAQAAAAVNAASGLEGRPLTSFARPEPPPPGSEKKPAFNKKVLNSSSSSSAAVLAAPGVESGFTATVEPSGEVPSWVTDPRRSCEDRLLIGFQICMQAQCAKPVFSSHPACAERRTMAQERREAQQMR